MDEAKPTRIPVDISTPPDDPVRARNFVEIHSLWKVLRDRLDLGRNMSRAGFAEWDAKVIPLLEPHERERLKKPLRPHIPLDSDTEQHARVFHLTKILWARQGLEKLMDDTGA